MADDRSPPSAGRNPGERPPDVRSLGERLSAAEKLRRRADYQRCYREGRRRHGPLVTLHHVPNGLGHARLGITASRKVGGAVVRHRLKRRVREIYRRWAHRGRLAAVDLVVHLRPAAATATFGDLRLELLRLLSGLLPDRRRRGTGGRREER